MMLKTGSEQRGDGHSISSSGAGEERSERTLDAICAENRKLRRKVYLQRKEIRALLRHNEVLWGVLILRHLDEGPAARGLPSRIRDTIRKLTARLEAQE